MIDSGEPAQPDDSAATTPPAKKRRRTLVAVIGIVLVAAVAAVVAVTLASRTPGQHHSGSQRPVSLIASGGCKGLSVAGNAANAGNAGNAGNDTFWLTPIDTDGDSLSVRGDSLSMSRHGKLTLSAKGPCATSLVVGTTGSAFPSVPQNHAGSFATGDVALTPKRSGTETIWLQFSCPNCIYISDPRLAVVTVTVH